MKESLLTSGMLSSIKDETVEWMKKNSDASTEPNVDSAGQEEYEASMDKKIQMRLDEEHVREEQTLARKKALEDVHQEMYNLTLTKPKFNAKSLRTQKKLDLLIKQGRIDSATKQLTAKGKKFILRMTDGQRKTASFLWTKLSNSTFIPDAAKATYGLLVKAYQGSDNDTVEKTWAQTISGIFSFPKAKKNIPRVKEVKNQTQGMTQVEPLDSEDEEEGEEVKEGEWTSEDQRKYDEEMEEMERENTNNYTVTEWLNYWDEQGHEGYRFLKDEPKNTRGQILIPGKTTKTKDAVQKANKYIVHMDMMATNGIKDGNGDYDNRGQAGYKPIPLNDVDLTNQEIEDMMSEDLKTAFFELVVNADTQ